MIPCELLGRNCPSKGVHHLGDWSYALHTQLDRQWTNKSMIKRGGTNEQIHAQEDRVTFQE